MSEQNNKQQKRAPWVRLASGYYQHELGEHPDLAPQEMFTFPPELDELTEEHLAEYDLPIIPCIDGHNVMTTNGIASVLGLDTKTPLSPCFVRDLSGRVIYTGYGPERKRSEHWQSNRHVTFPAGCRIVTRNIEGSEYIGNIFFTRFRTLDIGMMYEMPPAQSLLSYPKENLYPYKLRLDTFYQDGWRLPQTNMLYARRAVEQNHAKRIGEKFIEEWKKVSQYQNLEEFYQSNGGAQWLEKLFQAGCTVIPTFNAQNSYHVMNENYTIEKRRSGRAVEGLHDIIEVKASSEPKNTILDVLEPGYITATHIHPAKVIVSDGIRYEQSRKAFPLREFVDLRLPHQRTQAVWGNCWVPTHPSHFDEPSIWGWDLATGRFLQFSGPIWDPLHYYYESTPLVVRAFKEHVEGQNHIAIVPNEMKDRFYPASIIKGFDVISYGVLRMRREKNIRPQSAILRVSDNKPSSNIGYHPLPLAYEYELGPTWYPELLPKNRTPMKPDNILLSPIITVNTSPEAYIKNASDFNEEERLQRPHSVAKATPYALENYPHFQRYFNEVSPQEIKEMATLVLDVPEKTPESLTDSFPQAGEMQPLSEATGIPVYNAVKTFKEKSFQNLKSISNAYYDVTEDYSLIYWNGK